MKNSLIYSEKNVTPVTSAYLDALRFLDIKRNVGNVLGFDRRYVEQIHCQIQGNAVTP